MKRWLILGLIILLAVAAIAVSESRKVDVPASPAALLYLVADTEHELTRMPVNFTRMSDQEEIRIGNELARMYETRSRAFRPSDSEVESYLTEVGQRLAGNAKRKLPYKFHYIQDIGQVNAFALPGGHVYVTEGVLSLMDSEDELAAVMGHEIEHIDHYHCAERVQQEEALRKVPLGGLVAIPIAVFEAGYSKDQELEADREGTRLAVQAGYSPEGAIRIFEKFEQLYREYQSKPKNPAEEAAEVTAGTLEGYFRTHPLTSERLSQIQKLIASENWPPRAERDLAVAYIFLNQRAIRALTQHKYGEAERLFHQSLQVNAEQPGILEPLARAQFAQANFVAAAATYAEILRALPVVEAPTVSSGVPVEPESRKAAQARRRWIEMIDRYAESLAAGDRNTAAAQFQRWGDTVQGMKPWEIEIEQAGLDLLQGNAGPASTLETLLSRSEPSRPDQIGKLGWWHYWSGDYSKAIELLSMAHQRLPGEVDIRERLAWTQVELNRNADALSSALPNEGSGVVTASPADMAVAVMWWRSNQPDAAMRSFDGAVAYRPEWLNPKWVSALYSPTVVQAISEMQQEAQRRQQQHRQQ